MYSYHGESVRASVYIFCERNAISFKIEVYMTSQLPFSTHVKFSRLVSLTSSEADGEQLFLSSMRQSINFNWIEK